VSNLGQIIRATQRDAAALPTAALRDEIEICLKIQDAAINHFFSIRPRAGNVDELIVATSTVMVSVLTTALYVHELTTRPRDASWTFISSVN
jgi:hypothetical protein